MSVAKKLLNSIAQGRAKIEAFYDNGIVEPDVTGTSVVIGGTALFTAVSAMVGSAHEMANYLHHSGDLALVAKEMISNGLIGGATWVGLVTAAAAFTHAERDGQQMPPITPIRKR